MSLARKLLSAFVFLFAIGFVMPAFADGFIVIPEPRPDIMPVEPIARRMAHFPLAVKYHKVGCEIDSGVARTHVDQVFHNPNGWVMEGTYIFPLPADAAVSSFSMDMNGQTVKGEILEVEKARQIYTSIVQKMRDPALLEYLGQGMFKASVFPIPANGDVRIQLEYSQVLPRTGGGFAYRYSLNTEKFSSAPLAEASITVTIRDKLAIGPVYSPSHKIDVARSDDLSAVATWEEENSKPDRDFVLFYGRAGKDVGITALTHKDGNEDGYFLVTIAPRTELAKERRVAKDVVFVLDTSGSMSGEKMEQAREALRFCVNSLDNENDRFGIIPFSTEARPWRNELAPVNPQTIAEARGFLDGLQANGGTNIEEALVLAAGMQRKDDPNRPFMVVFMTDGKPSVGLTDEASLLQKAGEGFGKNARLFVFGVGTNLNTKLLDKLADDFRGAREYVQPSQDIEVVVSDFYNKVSSPVLADVEVSIDGAGILDVYPKKLPDIFHGAQVTVLGRYKTAGTRAIRLRGVVNGERHEYVYETELTDEADAHYLGRIWAGRKIAYLTDSIRLDGDNAELREEIIKLSKHYGIVTPFTAYLVVEESAGEPPVPGQPRPMSAAPERDSMRRALQGSASAPAEAEEARKSGEVIARGRSDGADAVKESSRAKDAREAANLDEVDQGTTFAGGSGSGGHNAARPVRHVEGRTFYRADGRWMDATYDEAKHGKPEKLEYLSEAYFKFLAENPKAAPWLALGEKVLVVIGNKAYEVKP